MTQFDRLLDTLNDTEKQELMEYMQGDRTLLDSYYSMYERLYEFYLPQMPYGTAKARDGDPMVWIEDKLSEDFAEGFEQYKNNQAE